MANELLYLCIFLFGFTMGMMYVMYGDDDE